MSENCVLIFKLVVSSPPHSLIIEITIFKANSQLSPPQSLNYETTLPQVESYPKSVNLTQQVSEPNSTGHYQVVTRVNKAFTVQMVFKWYGCVL